MHDNPKYDSNNKNSLHIWLRRTLLLQPTAFRKTKIFNI